MDELINKSASQWISESQNQWTNEAMIQQCNESMKQWINNSMNQWINEWTIQWVNESLNHQLFLNDSMNQIQWINESMNQWSNDSVSQWINEPVNQWITEPMNQLILSTPSSKNNPIPSVFCDLEVQIELWLWSRAHFASFIFQKCSDALSFLQFRNAKQILWNANRALATVSCTFCQHHLPKALRTCHGFGFWKCKSGSRYMLGFYDFNMKSSSGYSLVHILLTSFSKNAPSVTVF